MAARLEREVSGGFGRGAIGRAIAVLVASTIIALGTPQVANAAYTYIFYKTGTGANNQWYFSGYQNSLEGGYVGAYADGYVTIQTQNAYHAYHTAVGTGQTYQLHAVVNNYRSACRFYNASVGSAQIGCQWRYHY